MSTITAPTTYSAPADRQVIDLHSVVIEQGHSLSRLIAASTVEVDGTSHPISTERPEQDIKALLPDLPGRARNLAVAAIADGWLVRIEATLGDRPTYELTLQWPPARIVGVLDDLAQIIAADPERAARMWHRTDSRRVRVSTVWAWDSDAKAVRWVSGDDSYNYSERARTLNVELRRTDADGHVWWVANLATSGTPSKLSTLKDYAVEHSPVAVDQAAIEAERRDRATAAAAEAFDADRDSGVRAELRKKLGDFLTVTTEQVERLQHRLSELAERPVDWASEYQIQRTQREHSQLSEALRDQQHLSGWLQTTLDHEGQIGPDGISPQYIEQVVERRVTQLADSLLTHSPVRVYDRVESLDDDYRRRSATYRALVGRIVTGVQISVLL